MHLNLGTGIGGFKITIERGAGSQLKMLQDFMTLVGVEGLESYRCEGQKLCYFNGLCHGYNACGFADWFLEYKWGATTPGFLEFDMEQP